MALDIAEPARDQLEPRKQSYFAKCEEKLGFVPNVLRAHAFEAEKLDTFINLYNHIMMGDSELSPLEREMIAVVVSSVNRCFYCLVAHGEAVRALSGNPRLGEALVMNYRAAGLQPRQQAMLDFAARLTEKPAEIVEADRQNLRDHGFSDRGIWDIVATASYYAMSNRMAIGTDIQPNPEYHAQSR
ncbi:peroxidase-related enzyme [Paracoccus sp. (in: a-proteobacteria)]|uniref:peroxidase-related enzyme n=1 Tax=Paracoccus sp. TaxID=267 RepID=UPI003A857FAC